MLVSFVEFASASMVNQPYGLDKIFADGSGYTDDRRLTALTTLSQHFGSMTIGCTSIYSSKSCYEWIDTLNSELLCVPYASSADGHDQHGHDPGRHPRPLFLRASSCGVRSPGDIHGPIWKSGLLHSRRLNIWKSGLQYAVGDRFVCCSTQAFEGI